MDDVHTFEVKITQSDPHNYYEIRQNKYIVVAGPMHEGYDYAHSIRSALNHFFKLVGIKE